FVHPHHIVHGTCGTGEAYHALVDVEGLTDGTPSFDVETGNPLHHPLGELRLHRRVHWRKHLIGHFDVGDAIDHLDQLVEAPGLEIACRPVRQLDGCRARFVPGIADFYWLRRKQECNG